MASQSMHTEAGISARRSLVPFVMFIFSAIALSYAEAVNVELLIAVGVVGALAGSLLAHNAEAYWKTLFEYMGSRTAMTATLLWLLVSVYGNILKCGHIADGLVWAVHTLNMSPTLFTTVVFLFSAVFAVSTGSGFGTISSMSITLFPAGVAVGAHPALLAGAILSGASLGDSIAPVSDTAVIAASTQSYDEGDRVADIGGTVKHRLPYVLAAMALTLLTYWILGYTLTGVRVSEEAKCVGDWRGLLMLVPTIVVIALSFRKVNIFLSLFFGIAFSVAIGLGVHLFSLSNVVNITPQGVEGAVVDGISGMCSICVLLIVVVSLSGIIIRSGCMEAIVRKWQRHLIRNPKEAEWTIFSLSALAGILIAAVNTIANISVAPIVNYIGKEHHIHPYRRVTILALTICTFPFIVPFGGCVLLLLNGINATGCGAGIQAYELLYTTLYPWFLLLMVFCYCRRAKSIK